MFPLFYFVDQGHIDMWPVHSSFNMVIGPRTVHPYKSSKRANPVLACGVSRYANCSGPIYRSQSRGFSAHNLLTPSLRRPFKHAIFFSTACRTACKHAFRFLRVLLEAMSTRWMTNVGWRVYTPVFLGVRGNTLRCPWTKGTAVSEWVHSFVDFCLIPLSTTCSVEVPGTNL